MLTDDGVDNFTVDVDLKGKSLISFREIQSVKRKKKQTSSEWGLLAKTMWNSVSLEKGTMTEDTVKSPPLGPFSVWTTW